MKRFLLTTTICSLAGAILAMAQVPGLINYQGRLTDADGKPVTGSKNFALSIYDAATGGNLLYTETIGPVTLDANGVYNFQFGSSGTSNSQVTETLATTDDTTLVYSKALSNTQIVANSLTVTDGNNSWSQVAGNPGVSATASANTISGFVIGTTITNAGSGYTSAPVVTISGSGSGAVATATISNGSVTGITITSTGNGYTGETTITIAPPVIPFRVDYSDGTITTAYASAPQAGAAITATYRYGTGGIAGALSTALEHWIELNADEANQTKREKILAVPFSHSAQISFNSAGILQKEIEELKKDMALMSANIKNNSFITGKSNIIYSDTSLLETNSLFNGISESKSEGYAFDAAGSALTQTFLDAYIRGCNVRISYDRINFNLTYKYIDNSTRMISGIVGTSNSYIPNPLPTKKVSSITYTISTNLTAYLTVMRNNSGQLAIAIPSDANMLPKIGLFLELGNFTQNDKLSATLVCDSGSKLIIVNEYSVIPSNIGKPQKIIINYANGNGNENQYPTIGSYAIRFSN